MNDKKKDKERDMTLDAVFDRIDMKNLPQKKSTPQAEPTYDTSDFRNEHIDTPYEYVTGKYRDEIWPHHTNERIKPFRDTRHGDLTFPECCKFSKSYREEAVSQYRPLDVLVDQDGQFYLVTGNPLWSKGSDQDRLAAWHIARGRRAPLTAWMAGLDDKEEGRVFAQHSTAGGSNFGEVLRESIKNEFDATTTS